MIETTKEIREANSQPEYDCATSDEKILSVNATHNDIMAVDNAMSCLVMSAAKSNDLVTRISSFMMTFKY